jgi:hypothetical protein
MVSNLGQTPTGSSAIGSDFWIAQSFNIIASDLNEYLLDSVELLMNPATGSPSGFEVSLFSAPAGIGPQDYLGSLSGSSSPSTGGNYSYTASEITLTRGIFYYVVVSSSTPTNLGEFNWSASDSLTQNGSWVINDVYYSSSDGSSWDQHFRRDVFQMGINANIVPEPSTAALLGLGLISFGFCRRILHT